MRLIVTQLFILGAVHLAFLEASFPLSVSIFCAEPRHKRIFTSIGAKDKHRASLV
ncbi:MAG TPA: hypothetical protein VIV55_10790 [Flavobacterium sp.]